MTRAEKTKLRKWARSLSNEELERETWEAIYQCLGSETEEMYERGYDLADIKAQEQLERDLCETADILEAICMERGNYFEEEPDEA